MDLLPEYGNVRDPAVRVRYGKLEVLVALWGNTVIFAEKFFLAIMISSVALLSDSLNHLMDITVSVMMVYVFVSSARQSAEPRQNRVNHIMVLVMSLSFVVMGGLLVHRAVLGFEDPTVTADLRAVFMTMSFSSVKIIMAIFSFSLARKIDSSAIRVAAWNHLSDIFVSVTVAVGVGLTVMFPEYRVLDPLMGMAIGIFVMLLGLRLAYISVVKLRGTGRDKTIIADVRGFAGSIPGVTDVGRVEVHERGSLRTVIVHLLMREPADAADAVETLGNHIRESLGALPMVRVEPSRQPESNESGTPD